MSCKGTKKTDQGKWWARKRDRKPAKRSEKEYILVASEDGESSTSYFASLATTSHGNPAKFGIVPKGCGRGNQELVEYVYKNYQRWLKEVQQDVLIEDFNQVWIVFDKDDFPAHKFDNAIKAAEIHRYRAAWSNECFELWYLLHFKNQITGISRKDIYDQLTSHLELKKNYTEYKGKSGEALHRNMAESRAIGSAVRRARRLYEEFVKSGLQPHEANPCTLVYQLIEALFPEIGAGR